MLQSRKRLRIFFKNLGFLLLATPAGDLFAGGRSSRKRYTEIFAAQRNSLVSRTSNREKHLENFSKVFFQVFRRLALATYTRLDSAAKIACVSQKGSFSILVSKRVFISFPRIQ